MLILSAVLFLLAGLAALGTPLVSEVAVVAWAMFGVAAYIAAGAPNPFQRQG